MHALTVKHPADPNWRNSTPRVAALICATAVAILASTVVASPPAAGWTLKPNQFATSSISVGSAPAAVAVDAGTHMVYVAGADGTMSVIDATTRLVVRTVPLYGAADHIAVDPSTHLVYVATLSTVAGPSHGYSVFDGTTSELLYAQFLPGVAEDSLDIDSAGHRVFLAPSGTGNKDALVQWFDTVTNHPAGVLASNVWSASGVAFDALTQRVFVVNDVAAGSVDMFSLGSPINHPVTVGVGASPSAIAFDPVTRKLFVTNRGSRSVSVIDATANKVTAIIAVGSSPSSVAVDPSTHLVYVGDSVDNTVTVIDGITSAVVGTVGVGQGPDSIAVDTSTHAIWISTSGDDAVTVLDPIAVRLFGADRFGTAVAISAAEFSDNKADAVVLARADIYPDALVGAPLAAARNAPLLFASGSTLPAVTRAEVQRVLPRGKTIYLLGGSASIPDTVVTQLTGLGYVAVRLAGTNRFATAVAVANELGAPSTALLASADGFADALTAGPAAAHVHGAILLTTDGSVGPETAAYLAAHPGTVYAIGGPAARADPAAEAIAGSDRFATATMVATKFFVAAQAVGVANGLAFPDALAAGAFLGRAGEPLLVTSPAVLTDVTRGYLSPGNGRTTTIFGGNSAVSSQAFDAISAVLGG